MKLFEHSVLEAALYLASGLSLLSFLIPPTARRKAAPGGSGLQSLSRAPQPGPWELAPAPAVQPARRPGKPLRKQWNRLDGFTMAGPPRP